MKNKLSLNYYRKYSKYKRKCKLIKIQLYGGFEPTWKKRAISTIKEDNIYEDDELMKTISINKQYQQYNDYKNPRIYSGEGYNIKDVCYNDTIPKKDKKHRLMLFNVHNFVKQCGKEEEVKRNYKHIYNFVRDKDIDYLLLTEMAPIKEEEEEVNKGNFKPFVDEIKNIGLNDVFIAITHYIPKSIPDFYFLANGIFGKSELKNKSTYNIGSNRILLECIIEIAKLPILLYLVHVEDKYVGKEIQYSENINNMIDIIKKMTAKYETGNVILCGDMNESKDEYDKNKKSREEMKIGYMEYLADQMYPVNIIDPLKELKEYLNYVEPTNKETVTLTGFNKKMIIDHCYVSKKLLENFNVKSQIVRSDASDHYPVLLELELK